MDLNSVDKYTGLTLLCVSLKNNIKELLEEMKKLKLNNYEDLFVNRCFNTVDRYFDILDNILYKHKGDFISIHAPRVGCDDFSLTSHNTDTTNFNPRTPGRVRQQKCIKSKMAFMFFCAYFSICV